MCNVAWTDVWNNMFVDWATCMTVYWQLYVFYIVVATPDSPRPVPDSEL